MRILALNSGSSSIKCALFDVAGAQQASEVFAFSVDAIGATENSRGVTYEAAIETVMREVERRLDGRAPDAVAHRVVHGGSRFVGPTFVDDAVLAALDDMSALAPLHNPPALAVMRAARKAYAVPHIAIFDTAFHRTLPARAREYALPRDLALQYGLRRYGFHGVNHAHVAQVVAEYLRATPQQLRIVSCHLGNGASVAAIEYGRSVETSMGMTPLEGLVMGTRAGDVDPGVLTRLLTVGGYDGATLDHLLNAQSGLLGLTGAFDFAAIEQRAAAGDEDCRLAIGVYTHRIRKYIGAYVAIMGGVDAIAFTGGVGEHSALVRHRACQRLEFMGATLDEDRNRDAQPTRERPVVDIASDDSRVRLLVVQAGEQRRLAYEAAALLGRPARAESMRIPVAVSARHAHLSIQTLEALFGKGYSLRKRCDLSQPGQFSAEETVALIGPKGRIDHVRLMGPPRAADQVEISRSDEFILGVDAPVRLSGDVADSPGIVLEGPCGRVTIPHGLICARRHIHMNVEDARRLGLVDHGAVSVRIDSDGRDLIFSDVIVRVAPIAVLELHLDTDEANAAGIVGYQQAELLTAIAQQAVILAP